MEEQLSNINRTHAAMTERMLAEQRQKLLTDRREAIEYGDVAKVEALDQELQTLPTTAPAPPPETAAFVERHASWWGKDQEATTWAVNRAGGIGQPRHYQPRKADCHC